MSKWRKENEEAGEPGDIKVLVQQLVEGRLGHQAAHPEIPESETTALIETAITGFAHSLKLRFVYFVH